MKTLKNIFCFLSLVIFTLFSLVFSNKIFAADPIEIYTLEDLYDVRNDLGGDYILMNDLDFQNDADYEDIGNKATYTTGDGFTPIGLYTDLYDTPFVGTFDGQNHTISNLFIDTPTDIYSVALFGANSGTIQNIGLINVDITGHDSNDPTPGEFTGGLVGYNKGIISNSYTTGIVSTDAYNLGGLVGYGYEGTISDSYSTATVISTSTDYDTSYGGLVGTNNGSDGTGLIENCFATGDVIGVGSENGAGGDAGGLVGYNEGGTITDSYATGDVTGFDSSAGGLVGDDYYGTITNSYATGSAEAVWRYAGGLVGSATKSEISNSFALGAATGDDYVGGLVGAAYGEGAFPLLPGTIIENCYAMGSATDNVYMDGYAIGGLVGYAGLNAEITNSYSTGKVDGGEDNDVGGLIGELYSGAIVTNSFWDTETSEMDISYGGTGKTTLEMKDITTFSAWDIVGIDSFDPDVPNIWYIDNTNDYARLFFEYVEPEAPVEDPEDPGETLSPVILTQTASNISLISARLRGNLTSLGSYDTVQVYFQYKQVGGTWIDTPQITRTSVGEYTYELTGISPNTNYEYRSVEIFGEQDTIIYASTQSFSTLSVVIPKVIITNIGLIDNVPNLDSMFYYFTSTVVRIAGVAYPNTTVKFQTNNGIFTTQADSSGEFNISLTLPEGRSDIEYEAYDIYGIMSETRTLTLVIGIGYFPEWLLVNLGLATPPLQDVPESTEETVSVDVNPQEEDEIDQTVIPVSEIQESDSNDGNGNIPTTNVSGENAIKGQGWNRILIYAGIGSLVLLSFIVIFRGKKYSKV